VLRALSLSLRVVGNIVRQVGGLIQHLYDLVIFAPLWVEQRSAMRRARRAEQSDDETKPPHEPGAKPATRDNDSFGRYGEVSA
jgi:hypothetical protein